jgi:adenylosuccinate lyase
MTAATQFLERTLDDSANRRIVLPEAFLAAEAALIIVRDIASGLVVYPAMIARRIEKELPFLATETIMMMAVEAGKSRQEVHERIRVHAMAATTAVRSGGTNDLLERIAADPAIGLDLRLLRQAMRPARFIGRAPAQVADYLARDIGPFLRRSRRYFPADDAGVHV